MAKRMSTRERFFVIAAICLLSITIWQQMLVMNMVQEVRQSKAEEIGARLGDRRMLRSRTNFQLPGFEQTLVNQIVRISDEYGAPWYIGAAVAKTEGGGDHLEFGIQQIQQDIRVSRSAKEWQTYQFYRMLNKQAWKIVVNDPILLNRVLMNLGARYNQANHNEWMTNTFATVQKFRSLDPQKVGRTSLLEQDQPDIKE